MLARYESLLLTVPEITADEAKSLESQIDRIVKGQKGNVISFERWGKYRLAYPVRNNEYGVYFLARFESPAEAVEEIKSLFAVKLHDLVMRNMAIHLDPKASLVYQRPQSLEDAPTTRDVNTFLKENKMEGLMGSQGGHDDSDFEGDDE
jgi:small subunit ribosomal protein S6